MREKPDQQLTLMALAMAIRQRRIPPGLIHHSDQGAQDSCVAYQQQLLVLGITPSRSRKGNCYDNAVAESFFIGSDVAILKTGLKSHSMH